MRKNIYFGLLFFALLTCPIQANDNGKPLFKLVYPGLEFPVQYQNYGTFRGVGTDRFKYKITDRKGLARAVGAGVYPNVSSIYRDSKFIKWNKRKPKNVTPWDHVNTGDPQTEFYVWSTAKGIGPGAKLFFTAQALTEAKLYQQAVKAYYAVIMHFPGEPVWSADHSFVWYVGPSALSRIENITKTHPELGYRLRGAVCEVNNSKDTDLSNDEVIVNPGKWVESGEMKEVDLDDLEVVDQRGYGKVQVVQYNNGHWQLLVDGDPMVIRGVNYSPTPVGEHISSGKGNAWMFRDENDNGLPDAPYDSWFDRNKNGKPDRSEYETGDFAIMKEMGVNTIRIYRNSQDLTYDPSEFNKKLLRDLYYEYGISVVMGDFLGAYTVGSGASWEDGTDYTDPVQLSHMKKLVRAYVKDHRNEPYVLMWLLGNENLMGSDYSGVNATRTQASTQVRAYLEFVNEIAEMIHEMDPDHPVAVGNLSLTNLAEHAIYAPAVDIFGANSYRGGHGFGTLWQVVKRKFDRPVLITEFGCDAYDSKKEREDQAAQARYHKGNWRDIQLNVAGGPEEGNALGGIIFEYVDEWWKSPQGPWDYHDTGQDSAMAFPDGWSNEEWFGIVAQGDETQPPLMRQPRDVFYLYRDELWK